MSQPPPVKSDVTAFVIGLVVGLLLGGTAFALVLFLILLVAFGQSQQGASLPFVLQYAVAVLIGIVAVVKLRRGVGIVSGLLVGVAAGMLGGTALCNVVVSGLNNTH